MDNFFTGPFLIWLPKVIFATSLIWAAFIHYKNPANTASIRKIIWLVLVFQLGYVFALSALQYYVWSQNEFTKILLDQPNYFIFYVWGRFWLELVWGWGGALLLFVLLRGLQFYRKEIFSEGDTELVLLASLLVAWPNFVVFVPMLFFVLLIYLLISVTFLQVPRVPMAWPAIIAASIIGIFGNQLLEFFYLTFLRI